MSWRQGPEILLEVFEVVDRHDMDHDSRLEFKADLLRLFLRWDIDSGGLEDDLAIGPVYARMEQIDARRSDSPYAD